MVAIHDNKLVEPFGIFYNKKHNLVIIHAINSGQGLEWKIADEIVDLAKELDAKEIISIEGVGTAKPSGKSRTFFFANNKQKQTKKIHINSRYIKSSRKHKGIHKHNIQFKNIHHPYSCPGNSPETPRKAGYRVSPNRRWFIQNTGKA